MWLKGLLINTIPHLKYNWSIHYIYIIHNIIHNTIQSNTQCYCCNVYLMSASNGNRGGGGGGLHKLVVDET